MPSVRPQRPTTEPPSTWPSRAAEPPPHPDDHRPNCPVLLAVDQELGEGAALRVAPELSDPIGALEVAEHQDVEQLGAGSGAERVEALSQSAFELIRTHTGGTLRQLCDEAVAARNRGDSSTALPAPAQSGRTPTSVSGQSEDDVL
jgi:hypothetical protein